MATVKKTCEKCGRTKAEGDFYTYKTGERTQWCKDCMLLHVNIWQPDTFMWIIEKFDMPWIEEEFNVLRDRQYAKDPTKKNNKAVLGKYFAKMRMKQFNKFGWADTETLQEERRRAAEAKAAQAQATDELYRESFEKGQITEAEYRTLVSAPKQRQWDLKAEVAAAAMGQDGNLGKSAGTRAAASFDPVGRDNMYNENNFMPVDQIPDLTVDLTQDDKKRLVLKWGRFYTPQQWVQLEAFYKQMTQSFDIQDADTRSTLILICKNNLKMNQAIDAGDLDGYQKLARVSDTLRKSAKFTAAQNKEKRSQFVDGVGQLVAYCEKHGGVIPRFDLSVERDIVDTVIKDMKDYTKSLIFQDTALARQIEDYLKRREILEQQKQNKKAAEEEGLDYVPISDEDLAEYKDSINTQKAQDKLTTKEEEVDYEFTNIT